MREKKMQRQIKFRAWNTDGMVTQPLAGNFGLHRFLGFLHQDAELMQYTGLKDKNGRGSVELWEGDILGYHQIVGNIYEDKPSGPDLVIPSIGTKAWVHAYKEAVVRGFDYSE